MKLSEVLVTKSNLRKDAQRAGMATKAVDLTPFLNAVRDAKDLAQKKYHAIEMAKHFTVGGADAFVAKVNAAKTPGELDFLAYNAALKGEGKGAKLY